MEKQMRNRKKVPDIIDYIVFYSFSETKEVGIFDREYLSEACFGQKLMFRKYLPEQGILPPWGDAIHEAIFLVIHSRITNHKWIEIPEFMNNNFRQFSQIPERYFVFSWNHERNRFPDSSRTMKANSCFTYAYGDTGLY